MVWRLGATLSVVPTPIPKRDLRSLEVLNKRLLPLEDRKSQALCPLQVLAFTKSFVNAKHTMC